MNSEKWQKAKEIFDAALKCKPGERQDFLGAACDDDLEVRREVESLLESFDTAESFLEKPAVGEVAENIVSQNEKLAGGQSFSHYEIVSQIGAGGMGEVYLANDTKLGRQVALKILPAGFASDKNRAHRFKQEARAASALNHPNIIVIYEIGEAENERLFIATEYIEGETLREHLKRGSLSLEIVLDIAFQIAGAIAEAHKSGIVHRDIKPENIMLRPDGYVKVLDFGLAKLVENQFQINSESSTFIRHNTSAGIILGTVTYMSPEQARGKEIDARSDIFSFGVALYEMIAGHTPFAGDSNMDTLAAIINQEPSPLIQFAPDVPDELQEIVNKTLRKDKNERYQNIREVLEDLKNLRDELQIQAKLNRAASDKILNQPTLIAKANTTQQTKVESNETTNATIDLDTKSINEKSTPRRFTAIAALVLGFIILSAVGIWFFKLRQNASPAISLQKISQMTFWPGLDDFPSISPDGSAIAYCSDHNGKFEIYVKPLTPGAREIQLTSDGQQNFEPTWSPDGKYIAYHSKLRGGIWIIPATGGEIRQLTDFGSHPAWSPDGKQIAFQSGPLNDLGSFARNSLPPSTLWLVSAEGDALRQLTKTGEIPGGHGSPAWSPDGKRLVFESNSFSYAHIWTISVNGSDYKSILPERDPGETGNIPAGYVPVYAPDGKSILFNSDVIFQVRINPETGAAIDRPVPVSGIVQAPSAIRRLRFSADGKKISYNILNRTENVSSVYLKDNSEKAEGSPIALITSTSLRANFPLFSPDGNRFAFSTCSTGGTGCDIWLANADGSNQTQLTTAESNESQPSWFPDNEQIAYISNRGKNRDLWTINLNTKREQLLFDTKSNLEYARLSPDGKKVLFNGTDGGVINVWVAPLDGSSAPKQLTFDKELAGFAAWSPDGKYIAFQVKRGDDTHVCIMPSEGGTPEQLTFDKGQSWVHGWSPDGDKILFAGFRNGLWNIWWVSRSTKKQHQLTDYKKLNSFVRYPSWSPKGDQIIYEYSETSGNVWVADLK